MKMGKKRRNRRLTCDMGTTKENCVGFCLYHKKTLSKKQMQNRKCLEKQCKRFAPRKDHPYWRRREEIKEARKKRKAAQQSEASGGDAHDLQALSPPEAGV